MDGETAPKKPVDLCANNHGWADTSEGAFRSTPDSARKAQKARILELLRGKYAGCGLTCDDIEAILVIPHQTASARITELVKVGDLYFGTDRRKTRMGKSARVYYPWLERKV